MLRKYPNHTSDKRTYPDGIVEIKYFAEDGTLALVVTKNKDGKISHVQHYENNREQATGFYDFNNDGIINEGESRRGRQTKLL